MRAVLCAASVLLGTLGFSPEVASTPYGVMIQDVSGTQSGRYNFKMTVTYHLTTWVASIRIPTPAVDYYTDSNEFLLVLDAPGTGLSVLNMDGTNASWQFTSLYNKELASAGAWIQVFNPDQTEPYTPYDFQLVIAVQNVNYVYTDPINQDIQLFSSGTSFTNSTQDIDSDNSNIQTAVVDALSQTGDFHNGNLGRLEKIHEKITAEVKPGTTNLKRASDIWSQPTDKKIADCDGLVNLHCAMSRAGVDGSNRIPCKVMLVGESGTSNSLYAPSGPSMHAIGSYWNGGGKWVSFEGQWAENFASGGEVFLSAVEDLNYAYVQSVGSPAADPISMSFVGSRAITNSDSYARGDSRTFGPSSPQRTLYTRGSLVSLKAPYNIAPHDSLGIAYPNVDVPVTPQQDVSFGIVPLRNPARGSIRLAMMLPAQGEAEVSLFDVSGRRVGVLAPKGSYPAGQSQIQYFPTALRPGVYLVQMTWNGRPATTKIVFER